MHLVHLSVAALASALAFAPTVEAQTLVRDFNSTPSSEVVDSDPGGFIALPSGDLLFSASTPSTGAELWISDGTTGGTQLVADLNPGIPGSEPHQFVALPNGLIVFTASTHDFGWELWSSDGTAAGTAQVADINPGTTGSVGTELTVIGNEVFFLADDGFHGIEIWKSDGTAAGTALMLDLVPNFGMSNGSAEMVQLNANEFVFSALINNEWELWKSDGTAAGTALVFKFTVEATWRPSQLTTFNGSVLFLAYGPSFEQTRWVSDGTMPGTLSLGVGGSVGPFTVVGSTAYFAANDFVSGLEPWKTDGTVAGTMLVANIASGIISSSSPNFLGSIGSDVIFSAFTAGFNNNLYVSDGTPAGTSLISGAGSAFPYGTNFGGAFGGDLVFLGDDGVSEGLWRTDGTAGGTSFVSNAQPSLFRGWGTVGGVTLFGADDQGLSGEELWMTDGTAAGTQLFKELAPTPTSIGSNPRIVATLPNRAFVVASDDVLGRELFATDGTTAGTQLLIDFTPGAAATSALFITSTDEFLFFASDSPIYNDDPWVSDGTPAGTHQLPLAATNPGFKAYNMAPFGDRVLFAAHTDAEGLEPWISDGTLAGTYMLGDLNPGTQSSLAGGFYTWKGKSYFTAFTPADGYEPWVTDGTPAGTLLLADTDPGPNGAYQAEYVGFGDHVYFASSFAATDGSEPWRSDGTTAGTNLLVDLVPGTGSSEPADFVVVRDGVVFTAVFNGVRELFTTDGITTQPIAGGVGTFDGPFKLGNNTAAFFRTTYSPTGDRYVNLWSTDGTAAGTLNNGLFEDFAGSFFTQPSVITDDRFLLIVGDNTIGRHLWSSDGTVAGSSPLFSSPLEIAYPFTPARVGNRVLFCAESGVYGAELFSFPLSILGDEVVDRIGVGVAGTNGAPTIGVEGEADASGVLPFAIVVDDGIAFSTTFMAWSRNTAAIVLPSVTLWTGGTISTLITGTDSNGHSAFSFTPNPSLAGQHFVAQAFVIDPVGTAFGLASATQALEVIIGP